MSMLVYIEIENERVTESSLQTITLARTLGNLISAVASGYESAHADEQLATYGVNSLIVIEHAILEDYAPEAIGESLSQLCKDRKPDAVLAPGTETGNEVMAHLAARLDLPFAANCIEIEGTSEWFLTRLRWGGVLLEDAVLDAELKLASVAPHHLATIPLAERHDVTVERFAPNLSNDTARTRVVSRAEQADGVSLATAPVVISGGRGMGSSEAFAMLEELAAEIGGAVGCSRVATNNGWRSHSDQVGQTGTRISPDLYIACGISGATQHWAGCMGSKHILAINMDPDAPLVQRADYAIIGDLHQVLPAVIEEVRKQKLTSGPEAVATGSASDT